MRKIKRIGLSFIIILVASLLLFFVFRNQLLKLFIENQIRTRLHCSAEIENLQWHPRKVEVSHVEITDGDNTLTLARAEVHFAFPSLLRPEISQLKLTQLYCDIVNVEKLRNQYQGLFASSAVPKPQGGFLLSSAMRLVLNNVRLAVAGKNNFRADINFSVDAMLEKGFLRIEDVSVGNANIRWNKIEVSNVTLRKDDHSSYALTIPSLVIDGKEMGKLSLPLKIEKNQITFPRSKNPWIGAQAYTEGVVIYNPGGPFCLDLFFDGLSMEKVVKIAGKEDEVSCAGEFRGDFKTCIERPGVWNVKGALGNKGDGYINIKKTMSGAFLEKYLDQASSNALIDNLKNYEYNSGTIEVDTNADDISVTLSFDSQRAGKRNFVVTFHDIIERGQ